MVRLAISAVVTLVANAIGLLVATYLLDDFTIDTSSFIIAVLIFTAATVILGPLIIKIVMTNAQFLMGGIALVTTFIGLLITTLVSDGLDIDGASAWIIGTLIVWIASVIAQVVLPFILAKLALTRDSGTAAPPAPPAPTIPTR
jgi:hypothetical protein